MYAVRTPQGLAIKPLADGDADEPADEVGGDDGGRGEQDHLHALAQDRMARQVPTPRPHREEGEPSEAERRGEGGRSLGEEVGRDREGGRDGIPVKYEQRTLAKPELYDVVADIGETTDIAAANPDVVKRLLAIAEEARKDLGDSLTGRVGNGVRSSGRLADGQ